VEQLYRVRECKEGTFDGVPASVFMECRITEEECREQTAVSAWFCHNEDCAVREVRVEAYSLEYNPHPLPEAHCPACGRRLKLLHFLREVVLEPVKENP
jgi:hypothetical protein